MDLQDFAESLADTVKEALDDEPELLHACCPCQRLYIDGEWTNEFLVNTLPGQEVSHGMCPECVRSHYPEIADKVLRGKE